MLASFPGFPASFGGLHLVWPPIEAGKPGNEAMNVHRSIHVHVQCTLFQKAVKPSVYACVQCTSES